MHFTAPGLESIACCQPGLTIEFFLVVCLFMIEKEKGNPKESRKIIIEFGN
jgi:hypothetical protein